MYSVVFSELAIKQLKKLEKNLQKRIISTIERCRIRPHAYVKRLVGSPYFRLRVGDYRVIVDIRNNELKVHIIQIDHHRKVYKT
ncbi:MAG: type II toxin-antitoxin system RelE/ParE family toxin [Candidatus Aenigmarchaeota archaeon]|nr:type II toxin-antitoxin system RelE/ParE family toxin [Candidatus Aenigmarchaeota archaeon]